MPATPKGHAALRALTPQFSETKKGGFLTTSIFQKLHEATRQCCVTESERLARAEGSSFEHDRKSCDKRSFRHFHEDIYPINSCRFAFETQKTRIYANIKNMFGDALSLRRLSLRRC